MNVYLMKFQAIIDNKSLSFQSSRWNTSNGFIKIVFSYEINKKMKVQEVVFSKKPIKKLNGFFKEKNQVVIIQVI